MADLLFILLGFSCFASLNEQPFYLFGQIQTSQTGGEPYSDTFSLGVSVLCSIPYYDSIIFIEVRLNLFGREISIRHRFLTSGDKNISNTA